MDPEQLARLEEIFVAKQEEELAKQQAGANNPFLLDQVLEKQAAPAQPPMNPLVNALMQRLGVMNMVRNRSNNQMVAGDQ